jgi:hypothetical protein
MENLLELTGQESGVVIYDNKSAVICNWANVSGFPRVFETELVGLGEDIPEIEGKSATPEEIHKLLKNVEIAYPDSKEMPQDGGKIYSFSDPDIMVIAPYGWG